MNFTGRIEQTVRLPQPTFLPLIREGQVINVKVDALSNQVFKGEVYAINPRIDESGRSIVLRARVANDGQALKPGLFDESSGGLQVGGRLFRNFGDHGKFEWAELGFNFRMPEAMGAIGLAQLDRLSL